MNIVWTVMGIAWVMAVWAVFRGMNNKWPLEWTIFNIGIVVGTELFKRDGKNLYTLIFMARSKHYVIRLYRLATGGVATGRISGTTINEGGVPRSDTLRIHEFYNIPPLPSGEFRPIDFARIEGSTNWDPRSGFWDSVGDSIGREIPNANDEPDVDD